jgi:hypothetical protein
MSTQTTPTVDLAVQTVHPREVQAVQLTAANLEQTAAWCHGRICKERPADVLTLWLRTAPRVYRQCQLGDWVVQGPDGQFRVVERDAFVVAYYWPAAVQPVLGYDQNAASTVVSS